LHLQVSKYDNLCSAIIVAKLSQTCNGELMQCELIHTPSVFGGRLPLLSAKLMFPPESATAFKWLQKQDDNGYFV